MCVVIVVVIVVVIDDVICVGTYYLRGFSSVRTFYLLLLTIQYDDS